jgi:hypothetical protein
MGPADRRPLGACEDLEEVGSVLGGGSLSRAQQRPQKPGPDARTTSAWAGRRLVRTMQVDP